VNTARIPVLDKGYVRLTRIMCDIGPDGELTPTSDLAPTNDARVSFARESQEFNAQDARLVRYLGRGGHTSPFRGAILQFEVKAPMVVRWQWYKYLIGADHDEAYRDVFHQWNEVSRRYVEEEPEFYIPSEWRSAPENRKQGSGAALSPEKARLWTIHLEEAAKRATDLYDFALADGMCAEQARLFLLGYDLYTTWRYTASLQGLCFLLNQRHKPDAQAEWKGYADALLSVVRDLYPHSVAALVDAPRAREREREALLEALTPFAAWAEATLTLRDEGRDTPLPDDRNEVQAGDVRLTIGDLRRAVAALAELEHANG
jgi:thymidylate synthase (FAD)